MSGSGTNGSRLAVSNRILVVDDEEIVVSTLRETLRRQNYDVVATTDPVAALAELRTGSFAVIIADQRMPLISGLELLDQALREAGQLRPSLESVIRAFIQPVFEAKGAGNDLSSFARLMARLASEPDDWAVAVIAHHMQAVIERFFPAFEAALDVGNRGTVAWAAYLSVGAMSHSLMGLSALHRMTGGDSGALNPAEHLERLICYIAGGMRALAERERSR